MPKKISLPAFVAKFASQAEAAKALGLQVPTLNRWLTGKSKPRGLYADLLKSKGIEL